MKVKKALDLSQPRAFYFTGSYVYNTISGEIISKNKLLNFLTALFKKVQINLLRFSD
jgi:hypothetical protein